MKVPLPHTGAKTFAFFFTKLSPAWAKAALHATLPAVQHAFIQISAPTRAACKHGNADADEKQGPEQVDKSGVDKSKVFEYPKYAKGDEGEREDAHGFLQKGIGVLGATQ
jgi:hypothetical protein